MKHRSLTPGALALVASIGIIALPACENAPPMLDLDAGIPELRAFGENCGATEDCASGLCLEVAPGRGVCTRSCLADADCPSGEPWGCIAPRGLASRVCGCAAESDIERCGDGIDNDCDGVADDCRICGGVAVPEDSRDHCGACGRACRADQECSGGECRCTTPGTIECGGRCVDRTSDDAHCGTCGLACSADRSCVEGACACRGDRPDTCEVAGGTACVDHESDEAHCGGCDRRCPSGQICLGGECGCPDPLEADHCGGVGCVDLTSDVAHCGACENACRTGEVCDGSECRCSFAGQTWCGGRCLDTSSDSANCGACGVACLPGEWCGGGTCRCESGLVCGGACTPRDDPANCGSCGISCRADQRCAGGACRCAWGTECGGACVDLTRDPTSCGACGVACGAARVCSSGRCACPLTSQTFCETSGTCVSLATDETSCGACGVACASGQECVGGACRCPTGTTWCAAAGACVDLRVDRSNCGACGTTCEAAQICSSSACRCPSYEQTFCASSGTCESLSTDPLNCGACGTVCPAGNTCTYGRCGCPVAGQTYCASVGACVDLRTDSTHCGACDTACTAAAVCSASRCQCPTVGETLCGDACVDTTSDASHCGACGVTCTGGRTCEAGTCRCAAPTPGAITRLTTMVDDDRHVRIASDGSGRVAMVWAQDAMTCCSRTFRFALLDLDGARVVADHQLSTGAGRNGFANVAWNGTHWGVVWSERVSGVERVNFQRFDAMGASLGPASDVRAHWTGIFDSSGAPVAVAWSPVTGWAVVTNGGRVQYLGLDGSARPLPVWPTDLLSYGTHNLEAIGLPAGGYGVLVNTLYFETNPDGSITDPVVPIGTGGSFNSVHIAWDGEGVIAAGAAGQRIELRRGPSFSSIHLVHTETASYVRNVAIGVRDGNATVVWASAPVGATGSIMHLARVALPVGGASFAVLTPGTTIMSEATITLDSWESLQVVQPTPSRAFAAWSDTRWGQRELYGLPLALGACR